MQKEKRDISVMPNSEIIAEINKVAGDLNHDRMLPNGLQQLVVGSFQQRGRELFSKSPASDGKNLSIYESLKGHDWLFEKWTSQHYNGFSGEDLAATALDQFLNTRSNPKKNKFPRPGTPEYKALVERMGELGRLVKEFNRREGWEKTNNALCEIEIQIAFKK